MLPSLKCNFDICRLSLADVGHTLYASRKSVLSSFHAGFLSIVALEYKKMIGMVIKHRTILFLSISFVDFSFSELLFTLETSLSIPFASFRSEPEAETEADFAKGEFESNSEFPQSSWTAEIGPLSLNLLLTLGPFTVVGMAPNKDPMLYISNASSMQNPTDGMYRSRSASNVPSRNIPGISVEKNIESPSISREKSIESPSISRAKSIES